MNLSKLIILFFRLALLSLVIAGCGKPPNINTSIERELIQIKYDGKLISTFNDSTNDFVYQLKKILKKKLTNNFTIILTNQDTFVNKRIQNKLKNSHQSFYILTDQNSILIYSRYSEGLRNGMYWYLNKLGFRWYFPGDLWEKVPNKTNKLIAFDRIVQPDFNNRSFFGSGGFPVNHPADPDNKVKKEWSKWSNRNLFGVELENKGHTWQDFVIRNKTILLEHPEYLASPLNLKDRHYFNTKLCIGNKELVKLFIKDREKKLVETIQRYGKDHIKSQSIGVEPSDGGNHCKCSKCKKIGSTSDQVFYLANRVAQALEFKFPNVKICLLAYNEHSAIPSISLHRNLFVTIVPYAFQHETMPEEFLKRWVKKTKNIQAYDYWGVTAWRKGKPMVNFLSTVEKKINLLKENNISNVRIESTYSIGAVGIPLYILSKLSFDSSLDQKALINELIRDCFGDAKDIMFDIFNRWSLQDFIPEIEQEIIIDQFISAKKLAKTEKQKQRIDAFKKYATFLFYAHEIELTKGNDIELNKRLDNLIDYSWAIMPDLMVHSYWMANEFLRVNNRKKYNEIYISKNKVINPSYWVNLTPKEYEIKNRESKITIPYYKPQAYNMTKPSITNKTNKSSLLLKPSRSFDFEFYAKSKQSIPFSFKTKIVNPKRFGACFIIGLYDENEKLIWTETYKGEIKNGHGKIHFPKKGRYSIKGKIPNITIDFIWNDVKNTLIKCGNSVKVEEYYYTPSENQENLIFNTRGTIVNAYNEKNEKLEIQSIGKDLYSIDLGKQTLKEIKFKTSIIINILNSNNCHFYFK